MQVQGRIKVIGQTEQVSESFSKRDIVVTTEEQYPQDILIQFTQDKCAVLNSYQVGQQVVVDINLRGREWTNPQGEVRYFNTIQGWKINSLNTQPQQPQGQPMQQFQQAPQQQGFSQQQPQGFEQQQGNWNPNQQGDLPF